MKRVLFAIIGGIIGCLLSFLMTPVKTPRTYPLIEDRFSLISDYMVGKDLGLYIGEAQSFIFIIILTTLICAIIVYFLAPIFIKPEVNTINNMNQNELYQRQNYQRQNYQSQDQNQNRHYNNSNINTHKNMYITPDEQNIINQILNRATWKLVFIHLLILILSNCLYEKYYLISIAILFQFLFFCAYYATQFYGSKVAYKVVLFSVVPATILSYAIALLFFKNSSSSQIDLVIKYRIISMVIIYMITQFSCIALFDALKKRLPGFIIPIALIVVSNIIYLLLRVAGFVFYAHYKGLTNMVSRIPNLLISNGIQITLITIVHLLLLLPIFYYLLVRKVK